MSTLLTHFLSININNLKLNRKTTFVAKVHTGVSGFGILLAFIAR